MKYSKAYQDIYQLPVYNWFKVLTENNFGFLALDSTMVPPNKVAQDTSEEAVKLWFDLNDQYIAEFGQDEASTDLLEKKRDIGILYGEFLETGNKFKLTQIEIKQADVDQFENDEAFDPTKEIGIISKHMGNIIDTRKTSVYQYYTIKQSINNG